jgi:hypothetical protein
MMDPNQTPTHLSLFSTPRVRRALALAALVGAPLAACGPGAEGPGLEDTAAAVSGTRADRSLAVTDPTILARFSFARTMNALRASATSTGKRLATTETNTAVFQRWMRSFDDGADGCTRSSVDPQDYGVMCPRNAEAKLATVNPFAAPPTVAFVPVGLFNRFDLMPSTGATCGEYRIVYAMQPGPGAPLFGRGFLIFEAVLPNPTPALGVDACLPVAEFWQSLTNDASAASRAAKLERFFYTGGAVPGFAPVVRAAHYGLLNEGVASLRGRLGQIRTNMFVDFAEWHLREYKLRTTCPTATTCTLAFEHRPVKANPAEQLFAGTHAQSANFRTAFTAQIRRLIAPDVNRIAMTTSDTFNTFESSAETGDVIYRNFDNAAMRTAIQTELTRLNSRLTVDNVLDRASTQTCGGCHQLSNGQALGGGLRWPASGFFVHIDEGGNLSPALAGTFLPARLRTLEAFINARETVNGELSFVEGESITGRPDDAAN